jgi:magnesium transporter
MVMINLHYCDNNKVIITENLDIIKSLLNSAEKTFFIKVINPTDAENDILAQLFKLHIITLKNIVTKKQVPKVEIYDKYLSTILYDVENIDSQDCFYLNSVNVILMGNAALVIAKEDSAAITEISSRLLSKPDDAFSSPSNLYYIIIDVLVDNLFPTLACFQNKLDKMQNNILKDKIKDSNKDLISIRKDLLKLERILWFEQEVLFKLSHENMNFLLEEQIPYIKDVYHHLEKLNASLKEYNDWASNLYDAYMAYSSSKTEDKINLLTIISFIFLPISTLSGWYGMNFPYIPELTYKYGYFCFAGITAVYLIIALIYFRKKKMM